MCMYEIARSCVVVLHGQARSGVDTGFPKEGVWLTTKTCHIQAHEYNVFSPFTKFGGPPKGKSVLTPKNPRVSPEFSSYSLPVSVCVDFRGP